MGILLPIVMTVVITRWSRREGWAAAHRLALAAGTLLTYAWAASSCWPSRAPQTPST
jgi:hypothetical protein